MMISTGCMMKIDSELDLIREKYIEEWDHAAYHVWHREYKDYGLVDTIYKNEEVIVISPKESWLFQKYPKSFYVPFIYLNVLIKLQTKSCQKN